MDESRLDSQWRDYVTVLTQMRAATAARLIAGWTGDTVIEVAEPTCDEWGAVTIGTWGGYWVRVLGMAFGNERLVLAEQKHPTGLWDGDGSYDHGWCYNVGGLAVVSALAWDPEAEAEPAGWVKRATWPRLRVPGERAAYLERAKVAPFAP